MKDGFISGEPRSWSWSWSWSWIGGSDFSSVNPLRVLISFHNCRFSCSRCRGFRTRVRSLAPQSLCSPRCRLDSVTHNYIISGNLEDSEGFNPVYVVTSSGSLACNNMTSDLGSRPAAYCSYDVIIWSQPSGNCHYDVIVWVLACSILQL